MDREDREAGYVLAPCHVTDEPNHRHCLQVWTIWERRAKRAQGKLS
jgi:hypothetical protein